MSRSDEPVYFLHAGDSRLWRFWPSAGNIAFHGGLTIDDWRYHIRGRHFFKSVTDWESYSGTPVVVILNEKKKRKRRKKTII